MIVIISPITAIRVPVLVDRISFAFAIQSIHVAHKIIAPNPNVIVALNQTDIISSQNKAISINAVCFAMFARAKNTQELIIYLLAILSSSFEL